MSAGNAAECAPACFMLPREAMP